MYYVDVKHEGLKRFRRISGADLYVVQQRAETQRAFWDAQWARRCELERKKTEQERTLFNVNEKKARAIQLTDEAKLQTERLNSLLTLGLRQFSCFEWNSLHNTTGFSELLPPAPPVRAKLPEPSQSEDQFTVQNDLFSLIFPGIRRKRSEDARIKFENAHAQWRTARNLQEQQEKSALADYETRIGEWQSRKAAFEKQRSTNNAKIDAFRERYLQGDSSAVIEYADLILSRSEYDNFFPKQWNMDLVSNSGVLVLDYELPAPERLPSLKGVKYVQSRDTFETILYKESEISQLYESVVYQLCLRTLYELFEADDADAIKSITFNGWVNFVDRSNGKPARSCIMSVQATKSEFMSLNLSAVDSKACFRALKGVGSAKLSGMAPIVPILRLNKNDERFVTPHDAIGAISEATNVAAISWEEFEFLVRDIFEKEFSKNGGEVKITRASRDHGVDAVAFDPDPIRGGKIVIQAKRYTNVVGVSAVRDLYGTLINEGANRGILVTTSQYGPDSYDFAKDKPITLLDGGNLLSLLDSHGHKARIDLAEAKRLGLAREER